MRHPPLTTARSLLLGSLLLVGLLGGAACSLGSSADPVPVGVEAAPLPTRLTVTATRPLLEEGGLRLDEQRWTWGDRAGLAWRASTPLPGRASVVSQSAVVDMARLLPADAGPWATINGGFYDPEGKAMGLVVTGGQERSPFVKGGGSGVFFVGPAGPRVVHRDAWQAGPTEALQSIDRIVDQGKSLVARLGPVAVRSAVVVGRTRLWLVALVDDACLEKESDGYTLDDTTGKGVPLSVFAEYLVSETEAVEALNLDGGVSTQLAVKAGGETFWVRGERGTINAVVLRP